MATIDEFASALAKQLNVPDSSQFHAFISLWATFEGTSAANNPLATTQDANGATTFNSIGVKNYPDMATGVQATAETLQNGRYPHLLSFFQVLGQGNTWDPMTWFPAIIPDLNTWGTTDFTAELQSEVGYGGAVTTITNAIKGGATSSVGVAEPTGPVGTVTSIGGDVVAATPLAQIAAALTWLIDPHHFMRILFVTGGILLIGAGIFVFVSSTKSGQSAESIAGKVA